MGQFLFEAGIHRVANSFGRDVLGTGRSETCTHKEAVGGKDFARRRAAVIMLFDVVTARAEIGDARVNVVGAGDLAEFRHGDPVTVREFESAENRGALGKAARGVWMLCGATH